MVNPIIKYRRFGFELSLICLVLSLVAWFFVWPLYFLVLLISLFIGLVTCCLVSPNSLYFVHKFWFGFAEFLATIFNPIVLGFIFFAIITPIALVTRFFGRDVLLIRSNKIGLQRCSSHWKKRIIIDELPSQTHFKDQF